MSEPGGDWKRQALEDFRRWLDAVGTSRRNPRNRTPPTATCAICSRSSLRCARRSACRTGNRPGRAGSCQPRRGALRDGRPRGGARRRDAGRVREARLQNRRGPLSGGDPGGARRPGARAGRRGLPAGSAAAVRTPAAWCRRRRRGLRAGDQTTRSAAVPVRRPACGDRRTTLRRPGHCTRWRRAASTGSGTAWWSRSCGAGSCGTMTCCV